MPPPPKKPRKWLRTNRKVSKAVGAIKATGFRSTNEFIEAYYNSPTHAAQALRFQNGSAYSPDVVMKAWVENVPPGDSRRHLYEAITEKATTIMVQESSRACNDPTLQMTPSALNIPYLTGDTKQDFGFKQIRERYLALMPCLMVLLHTLLTEPNAYERRNRIEKQDKQAFAERIIVVIISMLLFSRNHSTNAFQMVMGVFMASSGASRRIIDNFNHMGLCVSYWTIQRSLKQLSEDSKTRAQKFIAESGRLWGIVYDNINFTLRKASQRLDSTTQQINATTLALFSLPKKFTQKAYEAALSVAERNRLSGSRKKFKREDLLITVEKHAQLEAAFKHAIRTLLLTYLPGKMRRRRLTKDLRKRTAKLMPKIRRLGHEKTEFFPLPALNEEEASVPGTVRVVSKIYTTLLGLACDLVDSQLRLLVGDWLSIRNLRLMKWERKYERSSFERFHWVQEASMPFHFQLNAMYALFRTHLGTTAQENPSSLEHHRTILRRAKLDSKKPEYNKAKELAFHSLAARLIDCTRILLGKDSYDDLKKWKPDWEEFSTVVDKIYVQYTTTSAAHTALKHGDEYLAHSILFIRDTLIFWEFCDAVRQADTGRMWLVYDFWVFMMRGAGCHNYGNEILEMKAQFAYEFPPLLGDIIERTWLNTTTGLQKTCLLLWAAVHPLNTYKQNLRSEWFKVRDFNRKRREVSVEADLSALCLDMKNKGLHTTTRGRTIPLPAAAKKTSKAPGKSSKKKKRETAVVDVLTKGLHGLTEGNLYEKWLRRTGGGGMDDGDEDSDMEDIDPAFADPVGAMEVDPSLDEDFPECPFSAVDINYNDADN